MRPLRRAPAHSETLIVQETHRPPAPILRYVDQVVGAPVAGLTVRYAQGILRHLDVNVLHVADEHLDTLLGIGERAPLRQLISALALAAIVRTRRMALVRTLRPIEQYDGPHGASRWARRVVDGVTTTFIAFDESIWTPAPERTVVIPHAHFRDRFVGYPRQEQTRGRVMWIEEPLGVRSDAARVLEITAAELVVASHTDSLESWQGVFLALSLDRPVVAPRSRMMSHLAELVGPGWVQLADGPITEDVLGEALASARCDRISDHPKLDGRDLAMTQAAYARAFRASADVRTPRPVRST